MNITPHSHRPEDAEIYRVSTDGPDHRLADDFELHEFQCKDGTDILLVHPALVHLLQQLRNYYERPVIINSAFRTHAHNANVGGSDGSKHKLGMAADIVIPGIPPKEVAAKGAQWEVGGVGRYNTFTHLDVFGYRRRWDETTS